MHEDNIESIYPLSPVQQGMLFHSNYDQTSRVYVESLTFSIHGNLDVEAFREAWRKVIERHAALRTFFVWKNRETPLQIVRRQVDLPWQEQDWRHLSGEDQRERLNLLLKSEQEKGFDLARAPVLHLQLIRLSEDTHQFIWSYHHILLDGWSLAIILDEVFSLYRSMGQGQILSLGQPQPYKAYINWLGQKDLTSAEIFWKEKLQGFSTPTSINTEALVAVPERSSSGYSGQQVNLTKAVSSALQSVARDYQLSLNTLFQGAWALLLGRYSAKRDVVFGAAVSGRTLPLAGIESMVGLFIASLPVRVKISPQESLTSWLGKLQGEQVQAREYEYTPLRDIQTWSGIKRPQGQSLFDTILSFNNYGFDRVLKAKPGDLEIRDVGLQEGSHYPLTVLIDPGEEIRVRINYDRSRFDDGTVRRILEHLQALLEDMAANPTKPLSALSLLTTAEKQKLLVDFNETDTSLPSEKSIVQLFEEQARGDPDTIALRFGIQTLTYGQLNGKANQLARHLQRRGVGREKVVALCLDRSPQAIIAILGALKAGAGYLPLDGTLPLKRLELMLEETAAPVILTDQGLVNKLPPTKGAVVLRLDTDWPAIESESSDNLPLVAEPDDLAYIIYTSGSTGLPKGTMVSHSNLLNYITWARDFYMRGETFDFPLFSSLSFDLTVTSIFVPLVSGGSIVIYGEAATPGLEVLDVIRENRVDIIKLTPAHLSLLQAANIKADRLRKMIVGGEDFKRSLANGIHDLFDGRVEIYNEYGPTEATVGCMIHRFDPAGDTATSVPIGSPIRNTQIYILDEYLQPVPSGVIGEMCISGAGVARGYLHRPELTEVKFMNNPFKPGSTLYRTGDLARWTPDGQMQFLGRSDHQVKIKGYRIELGEIESNLLEHPDIEAAVVTVFQPEAVQADNVTRRCARCGLPDNYPGATFDLEGVCNTCREFSTLRERFRPYFKTPADLQKIVDHAKETRKGKYDCMVFYSGGKDSTYMLYQLVREFGMQPLVFNLDNGYISEEAKANIRRVTDDLGVDLVFGQTPHMDAVFVDSLKRHSNVCDGCFKVIYTLGINLARRHGIRYIFTGLSRGQLFETRLSDMFQARIFDVEEIDQTVLAARKAYHRVEDAVKQLLDVRVFESDTIFDEVQLVDFYRYTDVPLHEMYRYLGENAPWIRPSDTGRSTNCLINDVGIYVHKKERGYHNYALPYSWDVRVGHKTTAETVHELNDEIDEAKVRSILARIGYDENEKTNQRTEKRLVAYYVSRQSLSASSLRQHLSTRLPEYMIPVEFVRLDEVPLTVNGKVDRAALPHLDGKRSTLETEYAAPTTVHERQLVEIWTQVFRLPKIGIHDNFFELGGDSIISIQIVTRAKQAGLHFTPRDLFEHQTIAQLALVVEPDQEISAQQGPVTGSVPLTPIQYWFFEQGFHQPHHWNQSLWLDVPASLDREALQRALNLLPQQHDALRTRFRQARNGLWEQFIPVDSAPQFLEFHDLSKLSTGEKDTAIREEAEKLERTINLVTGPLWKAALFRLGLGLPFRLFLTCHHLVIDGISWQPLLADWETAYHQIRHGQVVQLPPKTTSFKEWGEKLAAYAQSSALNKELDYWLPGDPENNTFSSRSKGQRAGSARTISCMLSKAGSTALVHEVHGAYNTNVLDLLLTAWVQAYGDVSDGDTVSVMMEGHGRETDLFEGVDLSHTVGWFTTQYPVHVRLEQSWDPGLLLKQVKERLRRVPNHGIDYGVLRYTLPGKLTVSPPSPTILFNYMGQFERALAASELFTLAQPLALGCNPQDRCTYDLEVNAFIRQEQLHVNVIFDDSQFSSSSLQPLVDNFIGRLESLIDHCLSLDVGGHTASDFGLADMSDEQFDRLSNLLNELDDR